MVDTDTRQFSRRGIMVGIRRKDRDRDTGMEAKHELEREWADWEKPLRASTDHLRAAATWRARSGGGEDWVITGCSPLTKPNPPFIWGYPPINLGVPLI